MAYLDVAVIRGGDKQHLGHLPMVGPRPNGRDNATLGTLRITHLDEAAEPML